MNGAAHRWTAGAAIGVYLSSREQAEGKTTLMPILGGLAGALLTGLPDVLEPATSPNHRAFFHSLTFVGMLSFALKKLTDWEAETDAERFWKRFAILGISAYLIHLALDFTTPKSLPLIGIR